MEGRNEGPGPRDEVKIEGRLSDEHEHNDGTKGRDAYAARVSYRDGEKVDERDAGWGHAHYNDKDSDSSSRDSGGDHGSGGGSGK